MPDQDASAGRSKARSRKWLPVIIAAAGVAAAFWNLQIINENVTLTREGIELARESMWLEMRPWVSVSTVNTVPEANQQGEHAMFRFHVVNDGRTPALKVRYLTESELRTNTTPFSMPEEWPDSDVTEIDIPGSGAVLFEVSVPLIVTDSRFRSFLEDGIYASVALRIEYCDANRSLHWYEYGASKSAARITINHRDSSDHPGQLNHEHCLTPIP